MLDSFVPLEVMLLKNGRSTATQMTIRNPTLYDIIVRVLRTKHPQEILIKNTNADGTLTTIANEDDWMSCVSDWKRSSNQNMRIMINTNANISSKQKYLFTPITYDGDSDVKCKPKMNSKDASSSIQISKIETNTTAIGDSSGAVTIEEDIPKGSKYYGNNIYCSGDQEHATKDNATIPNTVPRRSDLSNLVSIQRCDVSVRVEQWINSVGSQIISHQVRKDIKTLVELESSVREVIECECMKWLK